MRLWTLLAVLLLAGACAASAPQATGPTIEAPKAERQAAPAPLRAASNATLFSEDVLIAGLAAISGKYIEPITIADLTVEGLRGLAAIDPTLTVRTDGDAVSLYREESVIMRHRRPPEDNIKAWSALTHSMVRTSQAVSPDMAHASEERIYEAFFDAALSGLDIFSRYAGAEEARKNRAKRDGFGGIGLHFRSDGAGLLVTKVISGSPAAEAGLDVGDVITAIDDVPTRGMTARMAGTLMRGPILSTVALSVRRAEDALDAPDQLLPLTRAHIIPDTVSARVEDGLLYLKVESFNRKTSQAISEHLESVSASDHMNVAGIIIDLRGNPGGLLRQSIEIADLFLSNGRIISTSGRHPDSVQYYRAEGRDKAHGLPIAVIVDGKSASAAEVLAAALQDQGRAVIVGATSYGKGTVQTVVRLPNDGEITLTWSRLMAPSGYAFHGLGIAPAICTSRPEAAADADGRTLIDLALQHRPAMPDLIQAWRQAGHAPAGDAASAARKGQLRADCPPNRLYAANMPVPGARDRETRTAVALLKNPALYARVLHLAHTATDTAAVSP